jgi:general control protein GCN4
MADFDHMYLPGSFGSGDAFDFTAADFDVNVPGTVSPSDLMNNGGDSYIMSNPASTAFPNLNTPDSSYLESPALASSGLNTSPMDNGLLDSTLNFPELDSMVPLFPPGLDQFGQQMSDEKPARNTSFTSVNSTRSASSNASPMVRQKSSPGRPPAPYPANVPHARKHSESAGISKKASRKLLPEIAIDSEDDKETAKRKKNTAAARKSRQRKVDMTEAMESEINRLRSIILRMGGDPDAD